MRITVRVPDDLGEAIKARTDNGSAYVVDALTEKLERERRRAARQEILERATDGGAPDDDLHAINQRQRREGDRTFPGHSRLWEPPSACESPAPRPGRL